MGILLNQLRFPDLDRYVRTGRVWRDDTGSITLEAAIAVPLLLTFLLTMISFVQLSLYEAGLRSAAAQAAHQLAVQAYPLRLLGMSAGVDELAAQLEEWMNEAEEGRRGLEEWIEEYGPLIPKPIRQAVAEVLNAADDIEQQLSEPVRRAFVPFVARYLPAHMSSEQLHVRAIRYPFLSRSAEPYVLLELEYTVPLRIPFARRSITVKAAAWERLWIGSGE